MILKTKRCFLLVIFVVFVLFSITDCKRGGGRRGGTYRGSSNVWGRAKQSQNHNYDMYGSGQRRSKSQGAQPPEVKQPQAVPDAPKASAPVQKSTGASSSSFVQQEKKQAAPLNTANTNTQQRPIGWNVGQGTKTDTNINKNVGWNVGNANQPPSNMGKPVYPSHTGAYPNAGASNYYGTGTNYNYGNGYHQQYPGYNQGGFPPQAPNYYNNMGGTGYSPMGGAGYSPMGGTGYSPMGYNHYGGNGGMMGSLFGGNKHGYGGYGGFGGLGGYGGYGMGGYGKRFGGGFGMGFGKHAFRNVMVGLLVWNLVSGLTRRPYYVYNYYNNPERIPEEIPLPANTIVLCPENVTALCAPNTAPLCTTNSQIMCVVLAQQTVPCSENTTMKCVNSTVTCSEGGEEGCGDKEAKNVTSSVNIPCVTNATIIGKLLDNTTISFSGTGTLRSGDSTTFCVTTLAVPQPEDGADKAVEPLCTPNAPGENSNGTTCGTNSQTNSSLNANLQNVTYPLAM